MNFETKPHNLVKPTWSSKHSGMATSPFNSFYGGINTYGAVQDKLSFKTGPILCTKVEKQFEKRSHKKNNVFSLILNQYFMRSPPFIFRVFRLRFAICYPKMTSVSYFFSYSHIFFSREKLEQKKLSNFTKLQFLNDKSYSYKKKHLALMRHFCYMNIQFQIC